MNKVLRIVAMINNLKKFSKKQKGSSGILGLVVAVAIILTFITVGLPAALSLTNTTLDDVIQYLKNNNYAYAAPGDTFTGDVDATIVTADTLNAPTGRTATYVVAASDAPDHVKAQADYVCDGTDDQVEIQAAIDALPTFTDRVKGTIQLSAGNYYISSAIHLYRNTPNSSVALIGEGLDSTRISLADNSNCNMIEVAPSSVNYFATIEKMTLYGNKSNQTSGHVIYTSSSNAKDVHIFDVYISSAYQDGIHFEYTWGYRLNNVLSEFCGRYNYYISAGGAGQSYFDNIFSFSNDGDWAIYCSAQNSFFSNIHIKQSAAPTGGGCLRVGGSNNVFNNIILMNNGSSSAVGNYGIWEVAGTVGNVYSNVHLYNESTANYKINDGVRLSGSNGIFTSSSLSDCQRYGMWLAGANNTVSEIVLNGNNVASGTEQLFINTTTGKIHDITGYIAPGEIRTASVPYVAGNVGAIAASWHNPEAQDIYIQKIVVENANDATLAATAAIGIADDAAGTNLGAEFFTAIPLDSADGTVFDSWVAGDTGAQTKWIALQDSASATDGWINMIIADQNSDGTGTIYITYCGQ